MKGNFLEKDLENILWMAPMACHNAGLTDYVHTAIGCHVQRLRQVQLEPYGIADLVNIVHAEDGSCYVLIQVVECKRGVIGMAAYAQAKRYLAALKMALREFVAHKESEGIEVRWQCILVGSHIEQGDFGFVLEDDLYCEAYSYTRVGEGVTFQKAVKGWANAPGYIGTILAKFAGRISAGAQLAKQENARIEAEMAILYPPEYWANLTCGK
jgi:hypothetical protein